MKSVDLNTKLRSIATALERIIRSDYPAAARYSQLIADRHKVILWTVREGKLLDDAVEWCRERGVEFYAVNKDYPEEKEEWNQHFSRKIKADMWIDDRNIGGLPDWGQIYQMISQGQTWKDFVNQAARNRLEHHEAPKKRHWWSRG